MRLHKRPNYRRPKDYKYHGKAARKKLLYTHRTPANRYERWILNSVNSPVSDKLYILPFVPPMILFWSWGIWGKVMSWVGILAVIISFWLFVRMAEGLSERMEFEREEPVNSIRYVWWDHFRVVVYVNIISFLITFMLYLYF